MFGTTYFRLGCFLLLAFPLGCFANSETQQEGSLKLVKVYTHNFDPARNDQVHAKLDASGQYLALMEARSGEIQIVDWWSQREVSRRSLSELPCEGIKHPEAFADWRFVPGTKTALVVRCGSLYLLQIETLEVAQKLTDRSDGWPIISDVTADGRFLAVQLTSREQDDWEKVVLFRRAEEGWTRATEWSPVTEAESIGAVRIVPGKPELAVAYSQGVVACTVVLYDLDSLQEKERFVLSKEPDQRAPGLRFCSPMDDFTFLQGAADSVVETGGSVSEEFNGAVSFRNFPTGEYVRSVGLKSSGPIRRLILSPDGEWVVSETCDDPQDMSKWGSLTCPLFTIWSTKTGEIVYEDPIELAAWTRWAKPRFLPSVKYLVVPKFGKVDIYELTRDQQ